MRIVGGPGSSCASRLEIGSLRIDLRHFVLQVRTFYGAWASTYLNFRIRTFDRKPQKSYIAGLRQILELGYWASLGHAVLYILNERVWGNT